MDDPGIAARIRALRISRGITQQKLADALGRSLAWVKAFEGGKRQSDPQLSLLRQICTALDVPLGVLLDEGPDAAQQPAEGMAPVRDALMRPAAPMQASADVPRRLGYGYMAFQGGNYLALGALLPGLIDSARFRAADGLPACVRDLADAYHLATIALIKFGDGPAAWFAADRALAAADEHGDPFEVALAAQTLAYAATVNDRPDVGVAAAEAATGRVEAALAARGEDGWTALGLLHLKTAVAAAGTGNRELTLDMIDAGRHAAMRVAPDANIRQTGFNATNVLLYEAAVLGQLGAHDEALQVVTRIHPAAFAALPRERRTHHLVDTAASALAVGRRDVSLSLLLQAERDNPQEVRCLPTARTIIADLLVRPGPIDGRGLRALAGRAGVSG